MDKAKTVSAVAYALTKNEYTNFIVETASFRAAEVAGDYRHFLYCGDYATADMSFFKLKEHHRNYMAANRALVALAKVAVDMGLENDILPDVPPPEAE